MPILGYTEGYSLPKLIQKIFYFSMDQVSVSNNVTCPDESASWQIIDYAKLIYNHNYTNIIITCSQGTLIPVLGIRHQFATP